MRVSLLLIALSGLAAICRWALREDAPLANWVDRKVADTGYLPQPTATRLDRYL